MTKRTGPPRFGVFVRWLLLLAAFVLFADTIGCDPNDTDRPPEDNTTRLPSDEELKAKLDKVIEATFRTRHLNTADHAAWQILHGALAYGPDFLVYHEGQLVRAVDHVIDGGAMTGWTIRPGRTIDGRPGMLAPLEEGSAAGQGHKDQWLAVMSQCGLQPTQEFKVGDHTYTMTDWINQVQYDVHDNPELSWTVIGLSSYLPLGARWTAGDGSEWTLEKIMRHEAELGLASGACGGSHRLIGMTMALNRHEDERGKLTGTSARDGWVLADRLIRRSVNLAKEYQQPDGSFSAQYFSRAGNTPDQGEQLGTSGHTLEFLTLALDDEQLKEDWVTRGVVHMCYLFEATRGIGLDCGKLYHAMHGLVLYRQRRFGPLDFSKWADEDLASVNENIP